MHRIGLNGNASFGQQFKYISSVIITAVFILFILYNAFYKDWLWVVFWFAIFIVSSRIWYKYIERLEDAHLLIVAHPIADSSLVAALGSVIAAIKPIFNQSLTPVESVILCSLLVVIILNFMVTTDDKRISRNEVDRLKSDVKYIQNKLNIPHDKLSIDNDRSSTMTTHHIFYKHYIRKQIHDELVKRATSFIHGRELKDSDYKSDDLNRQMNNEAKKLALYELHHMESSFHE